MFGRAADRAELHLNSSVRCCFAQLQQVGGETLPYQPQKQNLICSFFSFGREREERRGVYYEFTQLVAARCAAEQGLHGGLGMVGRPAVTPTLSPAAECNDVA